MSVALLSVAGCAGDGTGPSGGAGDARIATTTAGQDVDPDGYMLVVDSEESRAIGVNDTVEATTLPPGRFVFELDDVAPNCQVEGSNPRTLRVRAGEMASTVFEVGCEARTGDLEITASTSGEDPDPDGYTVTVDGADPRSVDPDGTVTVAGLDRGTHTVELGDVAPNCSVQGENPRQVDVPASGAGSTAFEVECEAEEREGDLEVRASTSGLFADSDGYDVILDDDRSRSLEPNGSVTFRDVEAGPHELRLEDISPFCSVQGDNPREVDVSAGETEETTFEVRCRFGGEDDDGDDG
ncbi:MAG: hypothetical protein ACOC83_09790 [Gemmatimonadota bacterium]